MKTKLLRPAYYILLAICMVAFVKSAYAEITGHEAAITKSVKQMGYPAYFIKTLGYLKILGSIALAIPFITGNKNLLRITEWALICFIFDVFFAFVSELQIQSVSGARFAFIVLISLFVTLFLHLFLKKDFFAENGTL